MHPQPSPSTLKSFDMIHINYDDAHTLNPSLTTNGQMAKIIVYIQQGAALEAWNVNQSFNLSKPLEQRVWDCRQRAGRIPHPLLVVWHWASHLFLTYQK